MTAKRYKVEVYSKGPPSIESFEALITWSSYHRTNEKRYILTSARPWLQNSTESWILKKTCYPSNYITCWWRDHIRSHNKWKMLKIHFHVTCRYQTLQKGGSWFRVTCPTTKSHIPSITWLREFTWQMNLIISLHGRIITNYNKLKKIKNFIIIRLKFVFFDIINGYWMNFMTINAVRDLKDHLFFFSKKINKK